MGSQGLYYVTAPYFENFIIVKNFANFAKIAKSAKIANFAIFLKKVINLETVRDRVKWTQIWDHKGYNM